MFKDQGDGIVNTNILEGEKFERDVGVQAVGGPFGEGEVENSAPFLAILFGDQPKRVDLKVWEGGGFKTACQAAKFNFLQEVFFDE